MVALSAALLIFSFYSF